MLGIFHKKRITALLAIIALIFSSQSFFQLAYAQEDRDVSSTSTSFVESPIERVNGPENNDENLEPPDNRSQATSSDSLSPVLEENIADSSDEADSRGIDTGDAVSISDIVNLANTNAVDSTGTISVLNFFDPLNSDIVVGFVGLNGTSSDDDISGTSSCGLACGLNATGTEEITIIATNEAGIQNDVSVNAVSGNNLIEEANETSAITTGSAYAASNIVNIANTNFVDSNYIFLISNNLNDWTGDLVFPGKDFFKELFPEILSRAERICSAPSITSENSSDFSNIISSSANSGDNQIEGGNGIIMTGDSYSVANNLNIANTNVLNSNYVFIAIKVNGNWQGRILSLPPGLFVEQTPTGLVISNHSSPSDCDGYTASSIKTENNAIIENNVNVSAETGNNKILGAPSNSVIQTGDAYALNNTINVANSNILGSNWVTALINVLGNWNGDIAFGRPDIWLGTRAEVSRTPLAPSSTITLSIDLANYGDADATGVQIESIFDKPWLFSLTDSGFGAASENRITWTIPTLPAGATTTLSFSAIVNDNIPEGLSTLNISSTANIFEDESNATNNSDNLTLNAVGPYSGITGGFISFIIPQIAMAKTASSSALIYPGDTVNYTITIKNESIEPITNSLVKDELKGPFGAIVTRNEWDLGLIEAGEEVIINYDVTFSTSAPPGAYTNYASLKSFTRGGFPMPEIGALHSVNISASAVGGTSGITSVIVEVKNDAPDDFNILAETEQIKEESSLIEQPPMPLILTAQAFDLPKEIIEDNKKASIGAVAGTSTSLAVNFSPSLKNTDKSGLLANSLNSITLYIRNFGLSLFILILIALVLNQIRKKSEE